ncbi:hypothetical protein LR48_Vigan09g136400 [Vigna angularis]|uniref:Agamous-like MADS-box protein n=1 Tax=Phaseolus angularis TaxID=3914 RepID=A0A0L9VCB0_PHAAN|nr:agamous-like MADS-box protein AGL80 [Vigna angularis]KAG2395003.1 Agamous-like MADS-box protein [Vigna angularis]KOM52705.1 hypothetical protein LR48_Vigan09g136400 [Vigna angularis]
MSRRKVQLTFIANNSDRKASYIKRKKSLLKKTEEISTLCGVEACTIVYGPYAPVPDVWTSNAGVENVVEKFRNTCEHNKKMATQESFLSERIAKGREKMKKHVRSNQEKEMTMFMFQCLKNGRVELHNNMTPDDLNVLSSVIESKLRDINKKMETLNVSEMPPNQTQMAPPALPVALPVAAPVALPVAAPVAAPENIITPPNHGDGTYMNADDPLQSQWFMDLLNDNGDEETIKSSFGDPNLPPL